MNYNLMPVKYFIDVVQTRGFISAAKRNYVSETAVSAAVSKLEKELGQKLLNRSGGQFSLTPVGEEFYVRAVDMINAYNDIWHHLDFQPERLIRIHFLQGLGNDAALFASKLPTSYRVTFDEEVFDRSISRLVKNNYDVLVGFKLAFMNNAKLKTFPLKTVSFDLLFNTEEVAAEKAGLQQLARNATLYLQYWKSTGIADIQTAMINTYRQDDWDYKLVEGVNSFEAACLNVNFKGGMTMVPDDFVVPENCEHIYRYSPAHLQSAFEVDVAVNNSHASEISKVVAKAIS